MFIYKKLIDNMKIGYPCINKSIGCTSNSTFRLKSYSESLMIEKIQNNLNCLKKILEFNLSNGILFFRISSDIIPFASHPICTFDWKNYFSNELKQIGEFIKQNNMRISMHPDQFVILNAKNQEIIDKSIKELMYHCELLDTMELDETAKVQIHVGAEYGDKKNSIIRFIQNYQMLPPIIKKRLVIENDDIKYSLKDCIKINLETGVPILFDVFHHNCLNNNETIKEAIELCIKTWVKKDGLLMVDYSQQSPDGKKGKHIESINQLDFEKFLIETRGLDFDIMLEIKDKEKSALQALKIKNKINLYQ